MAGPLKVFNNIFFGFSNINHLNSIHESYSFLKLYHFMKKDQGLMKKTVSKLEISPVQISLRNTLVKHDWYKCKEDATNTQYEDVEVPALTNHKILNKHKVCNKRAIHISISTF